MDKKDTRFIVNVQDEGAGEAEKFFCKDLHTAGLFATLIPNRIACRFWIKSRMTEESGRSMVEMLGTLAIIGVLSVVGLAVYRVAVDKHKANTLIQEAQRRAVIVAGQIGFNGNTPSLAEFEPYKNTSAGTFDSRVYYNEDGLYKQFGIKVDEVEKSVCQNVLNTIGDTTPVRRLSKDNALTTPIVGCDNNKSAYIIIYNEDMTANDKVEPPTTCKNDSECKTECATCKIEDGEEEGVCVGECDSACEVGDTCGDNECVLCDSETKTCQNQCEELEYLESSGSQYIDTGVYPAQLTKVSIDMEFTSLTKQSVLGSNNGASQNTGWNNLFGINETTNKTNVFWSQWGIGYDGIFTKDTNRHTHTFERNGNTSWTYTVDTISFTNTTGIATQPTNNQRVMYLFACNNNGVLYRQAHVKIYSCQILGDVVKDFIPVHTQFETNGKHNCMFDKVSKKLFCNAGSGDFTAGLKK